MYNSYSTIFFFSLNTQIVILDYCIVPAVRIQGPGHKLFKL